MLLDWLVPDIFKGVKDEIRRERLLASQMSKKFKGGHGATGPREDTYT